MEYVEVSASGREARARLRERETQTAPGSNGQLSFSGCDRRFNRLWRRHGGNSSIAAAGRCTRRSRSSRDQAQRLPHLGIEFRQDILVVLQELTGILASLANAFTLVAEPGAGLLENVVVHRQIEQIAFSGNPFAVQDVELRLAERRRYLVLDHLDLGPRPGNDVA